MSVYERLLLTRRARLRPTRLSRDIVRQFNEERERQRGWVKRHLVNDALETKAVHYGPESV